MTSKAMGLPKLQTGIPGFDSITNGGLPLHRTTLMSGTAGSAKTVFGCQYLAAGIEQAGQTGVFVTFEEPPVDIRRNMLGFGWDIAAWEAAGKWAFVDVSPHLTDDTVIGGEYDLGALLARMENAVSRIGAERLVMDSLGAVFTQIVQSKIVRNEMLRITTALKKLGVTSILTAERTEEFGAIGRYGIEEFVTDNVVVLRNVLEDEKRRRTIEILKFRGTDHQKGEYPFTIHPRGGVIVLPLSALELKQQSTDLRITSGNKVLDEMCGGGFFRDSVILVSGATGTGKTLTVTQFVNGGATQGERCLLFAFEESREQLFRNARGWGLDFRELEESGCLRVICTYPEVAGLEDHLVAMKAEIEAFKPNRVAVDSLSALERVGSPKGFREFVIGLTSFIKHHEMAGLFTATTPTLLGGASVTEAHISTITDSILLLRYVEMYGVMRRGMTVLKMRGSMHDKEIREVSIDSSGMHIGSPFRNVSGILAGVPVHASEREIARLNDMFGQ